MNDNPPTKYFFSFWPKKWSEAKQFCEAGGAELATVETEEVHRKIVENIKELGMTRFSWWLGGFQSIDDQQWYWRKKTGQVKINDSSFNLWKNEKPTVKRSFSPRLCLHKHVMKWVGRPGRLRLCCICAYSGDINMTYFENERMNDWGKIERLRGWPKYL